MGHRYKIDAYRTFFKTEPVFEYTFPLVNLGLQVTAVFRAYKTMRVNGLMYLRFCISHRRRKEFLNIVKNLRHYVPCDSEFQATGQRR